MAGIADIRTSLLAARQQIDAALRLLGAGCPDCHGTGVRWSQTPLSPCEPCPCREHGEDERRSAQGE